MTELKRYIHSAYFKNIIPDQVHILEKLRGVGMYSKLGVILSNGKWETMEGTTFR